MIAFLAISFFFSNILKLKDALFSDIMLLTIIKITELNPSKTESGHQKGEFTCPVRIVEPSGKKTLLLSWPRLSQQKAIDSLFTRSLPISVHSLLKSFFPYLERTCMWLNMMVDLPVSDQYFGGLHRDQRGYSFASGQVSKQMWYQQLILLLLITVLLPWSWQIYLSPGSELLFSCI